MSSLEASGERAAPVAGVRSSPALKFHGPKSPVLDPVKDITYASQHG